MPDLKMYYLVTSGNNAMILGREMQQATHRRQKTISVNYGTQRCATKLCRDAECIICRQLMGLNIMIWITPFMHLNRAYIVVLMSCRSLTVDDGIQMLSSWGRFIAWLTCTVQKPAAWEDAAWRVMFNKTSP